MEVILMRLNFVQAHGNRTWFGLTFLIAMAALLLVSSGDRGVAEPSKGLSAGATATAPAPQQLPRPWTALGSTGTVDEASLNLFAFVSTELGFKPNTPGNILVARYNVTNTFDNNANPNRPGWTTLEMGSNAPLNVIIEAKLFEVKSCSPAQVLLCTARNRSNDNPCARCTIEGTIDFTDKLYYVEVTLNRTGAPASLPRMFTLRLF